MENFFDKLGARMSSKARNGSNSGKRDDLKIDANGFDKYDRTVMNAEKAQRKYIENQKSRKFVRILLWIPEWGRQEMIDLAVNLRNVHKEQMDELEKKLKQKSAAQIRREQELEDTDRTGLIGLEGE